MSVERHIRRHARRGLGGAAAAVMAMTALTASQAPMSVAAQSAAEPSPPPGTAITGNSPYRTELPPLKADPEPEAAAPSKAPDAPDEAAPEAGAAGSSGVPATVLGAYRRTETVMARAVPGCNLPWELLAAIGKVESGHARNGRVTADGTAAPAILGPQLNGDGFASIPDTDGGRYDGDTAYDRAVGPMQFIPSTWASWGADGNADGVRDPNNIHDATLGAGLYLCADGRNLARAADLDRAVLGYNHSSEYLATVKSWLGFYETGVHRIPDTGATGPVGIGVGTGVGTGTDAGGTGSTDAGRKPGDKGSEGKKDEKEKGKGKDEKPADSGSGSGKGDGSGKTPSPGAGSGSGKPSSPTPTPSDPAPAPEPEPGSPTAPAPSAPAPSSPAPEPEPAPEEPQEPGCLTPIIEKITGVCLIPLPPS
ncbi:lytic transglycosylase domain-containing protein [Streptomyces sp. HB2AG]|uniref:lytic transglycosylase domain-containing protein n=1 Tax=Streptomyces sp. HB2AG TaxID=2983400 RepID=UPI0022AB26D9|nr:lytic transglycosylase domain-containing protein [Streptomyces sp. HB2AG]MCZ2525682.1 lytic transglycosylase domain-containing protein [Streptomyces sp. HB2AG]